MDEKGLKNMDSVLAQMQDAVTLHVADAYKEGITDLSDLDGVAMGIEDARGCLGDFLRKLDGDGAP